ncbi:40-residue YVTN beta-propeller repeat protein [Candidatus Koribacter versatilis Ellin345]|uniref:40-residue YVTN beta-propeller repeat protein n=1 Tax=Koribacter versatilis (strain Ellin345) TaxID=204669 RepID=Q1IMJ2_KORVE|nr:ThuA domain-containing protein [Candidatus Koribacter versatilis]ABF41908.1 40-residue YVTN beta-propeller repeat protein [Candidatus Koribacter versatilis Ellin345]
MIKRAVFVVALFVLFALKVAQAQTSPRFHVLAFYTTETEPDHVQFAQQALDYFRELGHLNNFDFDATADWSELNGDTLKKYQLVVWLNGAPTKPEQRAAFEQYMTNGGAWLGFHFSGYNDESTHWPWFVDFMGGAVFYDNSWPPMPAKIRVDAREHPATAGLPESYVAPNNEWYIWTPSPRLSKDVQVLLTLDPANYPLGLKGILTQGDLPIVWTNTRYKMVYMNIGHGDRIFTSDIQNRLIANATFWLTSGKAAPQKTVAKNEFPPAVGTEISLRGVAVNPKTSKVYAVNTVNGTVTVVDAVTRIAKTVKVGAGPEALDINPQTNKIYVANTGSASISVIDGNTDSATATIPVGNFPYRIAANPASDKIYISKTFGDAMIVIDGKTNTTQSMAKGSAADIIAVNAEANKLYFVHYEGNDVTVLNGATNAAIQVPAGNHIWGATVDPSTDRAYFSLTGASRIAVLDGKTNTVTYVPTGEFPCAIAADVVNHRVYVANYATGSVSVIDSSNNNLLATVAVAQHPQAVAIDPVNKRVYVASTVGNSVTVIDEKTNAVVGTVKTDSRPYAIAVDSQTDTAFVAGVGGKLVLVEGKSLKVVTVGN